MAATERDGAKQSVWPEMKRCHFSRAWTSSRNREFEMKEMTIRGFFIISSSLPLSRALSSAALYII